MHHGELGHALGGALLRRPHHPPRGAERGAVGDAAGHEPPVVQRRQARRRPAPRARTAARRKRPAELRFKRCGVAGVAPEVVATVGDGAPDLPRPPRGLGLLVPRELPLERHLLPAPPRGPRVVSLRLHDAGRGGPVEPREGRGAAEVARTGSTEHVAGCASWG
jgi:hypothetical protein